jgi:uncharacterized coiled-coil DUF342 family protein
METYMNSHNRKLVTDAREFVASMQGYMEPSWELMDYVKPLADALEESDNEVVRLRMGSGSAELKKRIRGLQRQVSERDAKVKELTEKLNDMTNAFISLEQELDDARATGWHSLSVADRNTLIKDATK